MLKRNFPVLIILLLVVIRCPAEAPPDYQQIEGLVQQDKYPEAIAKLDALIKEYPDNQKLKDMRASLQASAPATAGASAPPPGPAAAAPAPALDDKSKLQLDTILVDGNQAQAQNDPTARAAAWKTLLSDSDDFIQAHSDQFNVWLLRADAALELNLSKPGWEAGSNLIRLGALKSDDANVNAIMGYLNKKEWIADDYATVQKAIADAHAKEIASKMDQIPGYARKLLGSYSGTEITRNGQLISTTGSIKIWADDDGNLHASGSYHSDWGNAGSTDGTITGAAVDADGKRIEIDGDFQSQRGMLGPASASVGFFDSFNGQYRGGFPGPYNFAFFEKDN